MPSGGSEEFVFPGVCRQLEIERRAGSLLALDPGTAAMGLCDRSDDRKPEPRPLPRARRIGLEEPVEDVLGLVRIEARPFVADAQADRATGHFHLHLDGRRGRSVDGGVP